jgi:hypothetical protein
MVQTKQLPNISLEHLLGLLVRNQPILNTKIIEIMCEGIYASKHIIRHEDTINITFLSKEGHCLNALVPTPQSFRK